MQLPGKRALVTGGTRGIGAAVALDFVAAGAKVVVNGRTNDGDAAEVCRQAEAAGGFCRFVQADVAVPAEADRCVDEAIELLGGLDVLVHSAGGPAPGSIDQITLDEWRAAFDVHVHAAFTLCRRALPAIRRSGEGAIVLVSSAAAVRGCPGAIAYGTVKGAILQFTRMLARDVADDNIRVNCVAPGIIRTRFHQAMSHEQQAHNLRQRIPLHREGTPADVAEVVRLLATNEFMTGEYVVVDGGMSMQMVR
ncbi:MAG: SDR family oxidoreductase [Pirellulales bacterium]|nr:SDR family oxidoreductase [Pirellulales bacterium]